MSHGPPACPGHGRNGADAYPPDCDCPRVCYKQARGFSFDLFIVYLQKHQTRPDVLDFGIFWQYNLRMSTNSTRRGRPRKNSDETKSESVLLRMEEREKEGFAAAAKVAGAPLSVWMRERLRRAAIRELEEAGKRIPFLT
jgi:hypothetical protein